MGLAEGGIFGFSYALATTVTDVQRSSVLLLL